MKKIWTEDEIQKLTDLHTLGLSFNEVANKLGRTGKAVKVKLHKLGFKSNKLEYRENVVCLNCGNNIIALKSEQRKFCSQSCAAIYNDVRHPKRKKLSTANTTKRLRYKKTKTNKCLFCGNPVYDKYCGTKCRKSYEHQVIFTKISNNEPLNVGNVATNNRWYKKYLIEKYGEKCMECGWGKENIHSHTIPIELEHIDGNSENGKLNNLKLLCPNCHSLTPTYKFLNKGNGRHKRMERYRNGQSY